MEHSNAVEKVGMGLVCSLETFKGAKIELVKRLSGFNGLSVYKYGQVRKIEVKTMQKGDKWIAINGVRAIDKLFFEQDYWIYFVLIPENIVVATKGLPFIQTQIRVDKNKVQYLEELKDLMLNIKKLSKETSLQLTLKINVPFSEPMRLLTENILKGQAKDWENSIIEIWENKSSWIKLYQSKQYEEI
jgi:hypothetical protein